MIVKKGIESTYPTMIGGSLGMRQAALVITRGSLDKLALQLEAFIVSGADGTLSLPDRLVCLSFRCAESSCRSDQAWH